MKKKSISIKNTNVVIAIKNIRNPFVFYMITNSSVRITRGVKNDVTVPEKSACLHTKADEYSVEYSTRTLCACCV